MENTASGFSIKGWLESVGKDAGCSTRLDVMVDDADVL